MKINSGYNFFFFFGGKKMSNRAFLNWENTNISQVSSINIISVFLTVVCGYKKKVGVELGK